ncbi:MAG TPA: tetratricopeptide repeat protein, partial [Sandaracinaceae bacterium]
MTTPKTPRRLLVWLEDAQIAIDEGRFEDAERALANVRRKRADLPELALVEGDLAAARGDVDGAIERYREAAERDPEWPAPRLSEAWTELDRDDAEAALAIAEDVIEVFGEDPEARAEALLVAASAHLAEEDDEEARRCLEEVESIEIDDPELLHELGRAWHELGDLEREESAYRAI